jgi:hypothetical protein
MTATSVGKAKGTRMRVLKDVNKIVQWRGGGYDGCIWEPNTGFFDETGAWHPVVSTGYGARNDIDAFNSKRKKETRDWRKSNSCSDADLVYSTTKAGMLEFQKNIRGDMFMRTIEQLEFEGYDVYWQCSQCMAVIAGYADEFADFGGYQGDGGIGVIHDSPICRSCYSNGMCERCGEFTEQDRLVHTTHGQWCTYCIDVVCDADEEHKAALEDIDTTIAEQAEILTKYLAADVPDAAKKAAIEHTDAAAAKLNEQRAETVAKMMRTI